MSDATPTPSPNGATGAATHANALDRLDRADLEAHALGAPDA